MRHYDEHDRLILDPVANIIIIRDRIAKEVAKYIVVAHLSNLNNIITIFVSLRLASSASNHTID